VTWSLRGAKHICLSRAPEAEKHARPCRGRNRSAPINDRSLRSNTNQSPKPAEQSGVEAFQQMYLAERPRFVKMAWSILRNSADAEDAVQNVCVSAYLHLHTFEGRSNLKTWFTRILINAALMLRRKQKAAVIEPYMETSSADDENGWIKKIRASTPDPEQAFAREERFELIDRVIAKMKPALRQAFTMTYYDELSTREACAVLGISPGTFKARLFRARQQLFRQLKRELVPRVRRMAPSVAVAKKIPLHPIAGRPAETTLVEMAS
jgi:RNA polymerase sigma-70 factor (ECF subfamily)